MSTVIEEEVEETTEEHVKKYPMWKVLLHNDDHTEILDVIFAVMDVFKYDHEKTLKIVMEAHKTGVAICKIEPKEQAEFHTEQLISHRLTATYEKA